MFNLLLVMIGGAAGSGLRYGLSRVLPAQAWPWPTLAANIVGGLLMGLLAGWLWSRQGLGGGDEKLRLLLGVGVLGGFTTFSSYSLEVVQMLERRDYGTAALYAIGSAVAAIFAVMIGLYIVRKIAG